MTILYRHGMTWPDVRIVPVTSPSPGVPLEERDRPIPRWLGFWTRLCPWHHWRPQSWSSWMAGLTDVKLWQLWRLSWAALKCDRWSRRAGLEFDFGWEGWPKSREQCLWCSHSGVIIEQKLYFSGRTGPDWLHLLSCHTHKRVCKATI